MSENGNVQQQANAQHQYLVKSSDLPVSCPLPSMALWNSHPKVYIPLDEKGQGSCYYCGAKYILQEQE